MFGITLCQLRLIGCSKSKVLLAFARLDSAVE